jgi:hypothetical protein
MTDLYFRGISLGYANADGFDLCHVLPSSRSARVLSKSKPTD